jgi:nucleoid-associated protein YgaU
VSSRATIRTADKKYTLTATLGPTQPSISDGRGGWTEVARPRKAAIAEWQGVSLIKASLEIVLDAWRTGGTTTRDQATVNAIAPLSPKAEPPTVYIYGVPQIPSTIPWLVQAVTWSDWLERTDGQPARVTVAFDLLERRFGEVVTRTSATKRSTVRNGTPARTRTYTMKAGDTLSSVAARMLGKASRWPEIAKLNGLRSTQKIKVGFKLRLPPS